MIMMSRENSSYIHHLSLSLHHFYELCFKKCLKFSLMLIQEVLNFCRNLSPRYFKECLPNVTVLYLVLYSISTVLYLVLYLYILKCSFDVSVW